METVRDPKAIKKQIEKYLIQECFSDCSTYSFELHYFKKGEHICTYGEKFDYLYFVLEGRAKVYSLSEHGKSYLYAFYQGFGVMGDIEFATNSLARTYVQAITEVTCLALPLKQNREKLLKDNRFLQYISTQLAIKLDRSSLNSSYHILYPVENRLAGYLIMMADEGLFAENLTEVAELIGTSYRHLLRILREFCKKGYLEKCKNGYKIKNLEQLIILGKDIY